MNNLSLIRWAGGKNDPIIQKILTNSVETESGCFVWQGALARGYGMVRVDSKRTLRVHRVAYEILVGPIVNQLDHLCRVRACWRPDHLEDITAKENLARSPFTNAAINTAKTACPRCGRAYRVYPNGRRRCLPCESRNDNRVSHQYGYYAKGGGLPS